MFYEEMNHSSRWWSKLCWVHAGA